MEEAILNFIIGILQSLGWSAADHRYQWTRKAFLYFHNKKEKSKEFNQSYIGFKEELDKSVEELEDYQEDISYVNANELKIIYNLSLEGFGEVSKQYGNRKDLFDLWYDISPNSFALIKDNNRAIGYCIVFPSNWRTYRKYLNGKISLYQFDENNIIENENGVNSTKSEYIYIHSVYLDPTYRKSPNAILRTINALYTLTSRFIDSEKPNNTVLFTEGVSSFGSELIKKFGFTRDERDVSFDNHPIYHLDFSKINEQSHKFRRRLRLHLGYIIKRAVPNNGYK